MFEPFSKKKHVAIALMCGGILSAVLSFSEINQPHDDPTARSVGVYVKSTTTGRYRHVQFVSQNGGVWDCSSLVCKGFVPNLQDGMIGRIRIDSAENVLEFSDDGNIVFSSANYENMARSKRRILMLSPVIFLCGFFLFRYRRKNSDS